MAYYGTTPTKPLPSLSKAEKDFLQSDRPGYGTRSVLEVAFNLVNATVGAGIIGLPFAMAHAGFFAGIALSIFVAVLSQVGLYIMIIAGQRLGIYKFAQLMEAVMGRAGYHFLNCVIVIQSGGACLGYFILLGDTLTVLAQRYLPHIPLLAHRVFVVGLVSVLLILPLNMSRSIGSLARWSVVAVCCLPLILATILLRAPAYMPEEKIPLTVFGSDVFGALGIMAFAFTCSQVAFHNYLTLEHQSTRTWAMTTSISTFSSWVVSMIFAIIGFLCFGSNVQPNLFMNFAADDLVINIGRLALAGDMILTIPMAFFPFRDALQKLLQIDTTTRQPSSTEHYVSTVVFFCVLFVGGVTIQSLGKVYAVVGGVAATTLAYILPGIVYLGTRSVDQALYLPCVFSTLTNASATSHSSDSTATTAISVATAAVPWDKTPLYTDTGSYACYRYCSSRHTFSDDEDHSTVREASEEEECMTSDLAPCWWLEITAGLIIAWGCLVMFFTLSAVISQP
ncbi:transmembrane amino acid transporter protein-domain-containing protein [Spinellus fusiger]|nr:transmembrane amino acid transporter protein-domain-containing protein [Spinellus fusiger]